MLFVYTRSLVSMSPKQELKNDITKRQVSMKVINLMGPQL